jgi:hypothetical protein
VSHIFVQAIKEAQKVTLYLSEYILWEYGSNLSRWSKHAFCNVQSEASLPYFTLLSLNST